MQKMLSRWNRITEKAYRSGQNQKIDCITMGNHTWAKKMCLALLIIQT